MSSILSPSYEELPATLAIFPLEGALLLPNAELPLHMFEPRYVALVDDTLSAPLRIMGMALPESSGDNASLLGQIGCAGRISGFQETSQNSYLVTLSGISRYRMVEELQSRRGYRRFVVDWSEFRADLGSSAEPFEVNDLKTALGAYGEREGMEINWEELADLTPTDFTNTLSQALQLPGADKQRLLEAPSPLARAQVLTLMLDAAGREPLRLH